MVEVTRKAYLASLVPVIVNAILNAHQVVADIVAFVSYGDFPRSRLGEKQRGKVLASWVTRKLRTIAQFSIREIEGGGFGFGAAPQNRFSKSSKAGSIMGMSARRSTIVPDDQPPRSPALAAAPPLIETVEPSFTLVNSSPATIPEVPQISEPPPIPVPQPPPQIEVPFENNQPAAGKAPRGHRRDFSFDFGDFGGGGAAPQPVTETLPYRPGSGYSQQQQQPADTGAPTIQFPQRSDSYQQHRPAGSPDETGDWPQEALMYQSAFGADGHGQGLQGHGPGAGSGVRRELD